MDFPVYNKFLREQASLSEKFSEVSKFCHSSILENAKRRKNSNKLLRHDPTPNDFVKMDNIIKIDIDDEGIKVFYNTVHQCFETLAKCIRYTFSDFTVTIRKAGSVPLNLKIECFDEFDFVLNLKSKIKDYKINGGWLHPAFYSDELVNEIVSVFHTIHCDKLLSYEINLFRNSYAVTILFSWTCSNDHSHSMSFDLAIDVETSMTVQEFFESSNFPLKGKSTS